MTWRVYAVLPVLLMGIWIGRESVRFEARKTVRAGERHCAAAWMNIMQIPVGELAYVAEPPIVIVKDGLRHLRYQPIPTAAQRRVTNLFATPPAAASTPEPAEPTTTTLPSGKPGGKS